MAVIPMIMSTLKTAEPTMVPMPISLQVCVLSRDMSEEKSSGAEDPAAMKVAPATSSDRCSLSEMTPRDPTKKSSQTIARPRKR